MDCVGVDMGLYLLSDTHFGHERIIEFCDRPFESVREMNEFRHIFAYVLC